LSVGAFGRGSLTARARASRPTVVVDVGQRPVYANPDRTAPGSVAAAVQTMHDHRVEVVGEATGGGVMAAILEL
jgi:hypothetical protein